MHLKSFLKAQIFILLLLPFIHTNAQIRINEICAANNITIQNNAGEYRDWIELYKA